MSFICLILSGAALLINGLGLLGRIPGRDSGYFNLLIGGTQLLLSVAIAVQANGNAAALLSVSGVFLFGLTYFYVGLDALRQLGSVGLGWFCGLVALVGLAYVVANLTLDPVLSVLWLSWVVLWSLFFVVLALGKSGLTVFTGWALILTSQVTTTIPALLGLAGKRPSGLASAFVALVIVALLFGAAALLARPSSRRAVRQAPESVSA
jgi:hypothetical protein